MRPWKPVNWVSEVNISYLFRVNSVNQKSDGIQKQGRQEVAVSPANWRGEERGVSWGGLGSCSPCPQVLLAFGKMRGPSRRAPVVPLVPRCPAVSWHPRCACQGGSRPNSSELVACKCCGSRLTSCWCPPRGRVPGLPTGLPTGGPPARSPAHTAFEALAAMVTGPWDPETRGQPT